MCVFFLTQHSRELSIFIMIQTSAPATVSKIQRDYTVWCLNWTIKKKKNIKWNMNTVRGKIAFMVTKKCKLTVGTVTAKQSMVFGVEVTLFVRWTIYSSLLPKRIGGITMLHWCYNYVTLFPPLLLRGQWIFGITRQYLSTTQAAPRAQLIPLCFLRFKYLSAGGL